MPSYAKQISIPGKSSQELYDVVDRELDRLMSKISLGKFDVERDPTRKEFRVKGPLLSATLSCKESMLDLDAKLSLMAIPLKSKIDDGIQRWIAKTFDQNNKIS